MEEEISGLDNGIEDKRRVTLHCGKQGDITKYILKKISTIKRITKGKVQLVILTCSRERAFFLFARICKQIQNVALNCHVSVGSLKFERDLKALNYGVDILIVTPGRIQRLYDRNENCFDMVSTVFYDEVEILFSKNVLNKVRFYTYCEFISRRKSVLICFRNNSMNFSVILVQPIKKSCLSKSSVRF